MPRTGFTSRSIAKDDQKKRSSFFLLMQSAWKWSAFKTSIQKLYTQKWQRKDRRERKILLLKGVGVCSGILGLFLLGLWFTLPNIDDPETMFPSQSSVVVDRNGVELYRLFSEEDRTYIHGDAISPLIEKATIAIEDERFLERGGCIDITSFFRAVVSQIIPGALVKSGGSTLPQQFAKNALVGNDRSYVRKIRELMLACKLQQRYNKKELLELYLNWIPYGHNAYGVEQAAHNYFSKNAKDVSLAEAVVLAALPQRPSYFNPYGKHSRTTVSDQVKKKIAAGVVTKASQIDSSEVKIGLLGTVIGSGSKIVTIGGRTDQVLQNMRLQGLISEKEEKDAQKELSTMVFVPQRQNIRAPHFVLEIEKQVKEILGVDDHLLEQGGFRIETTLDWKLQEIAEKVVKKKKDDAIKRFGVHNIALLALAPNTREVLSYVGNADYNDEEHEGKIDMVNAPRQPGSSFKPLTYLTAFEAGYGPGSILYDVPTKFGSDEPQNFDGTFWGPISIRRSLAGSRNIPAIKAFFLGGGEDAVLSLASRMGVPTPLNTKNSERIKNANFGFGWPLAIGSAEVPLREMVAGYASIADGGMSLPITMLTKITDKDGNIRYSEKKETPKRVIDERFPAMITSILSDNDARPDNEYWKSILSISGVQAAAKTGTSNKCLERNESGNCTLRRPESLWTIGYTPNLITGVWAGNATSASLFEKADGLTVAAPIWHDFMAEANQYTEGKKTAFTLPSGLSQPLLSLLSGKLASSCTPIPLRASDLVLEEDIPTEEDPSCVLEKVDQVTGLLPSKECPEDAVKESAFFAPKSEIPARWPLWEQGVQNWAQKQNTLYLSDPSHSGSLLPLPILPTEKCDPSLTPGRLEKPQLIVTTPQNGGTIPPSGFLPKIEVISQAKIREITVALDDILVGSYSTLPLTDRVKIPSALKEGTHTLVITVIDEYFNKVSQSLRVTIANDRLNPVVRILSPENGITIQKGQTVMIDAEITDTSGVERVQFFLDGKLLTTKRSLPFSLPYTFTESPGMHQLKVTAKDGEGNEGEDEVSINVQ